MTSAQTALDDRLIGTRLAAPEVERLREAIEWLRASEAVTIDALARRTGAPAEALRIFLYRPGPRPDNDLLGKLARYAAANAGLLPARYFAVAGPAETAP